MDSSPQLKKYVSGFTLIELIISVGIIALITGIVVFNQGDLSDEVSLNNVTNDIALQIRESQVYGISVRELAPSTQNFSIAYGVDFNIGSGGNNSIFYGFADQNSNTYFDTPSTCSIGTNECIAINRISRGNVVSGLAVITAQNNLVSVGRVDISFLRPNPAANITLFDASGNNITSSYAGMLGAKITLTSPKGNTKAITVYSTGQISVQ